MSRGRRPGQLDHGPDRKRAEAERLWKVECYALRVDALDKLEGVIARAIRAWNTLHRPGAS